MNLDTLVENFYKKEDKNSRLINEVLQFLLEGGETPAEEPRGPSPSQIRRDQILRFPILVPAEQSVGQYTIDEGSHDREIFQLWMSKIGGSSDDLEGKVQAIESWINNPASVDHGSVAEALSYAMFLQTFSYMLREFNASVAGFLWEPFLAAMMGGDSKQIHTDDGDIADVKFVITKGGEEQRVSLKILREDGQVGGSFSDLVDHFAVHPEQPMTYIVIRKTGDEIIKTEMRFMQFPVSEEKFFHFVGPPKIQKKLVRSDKVIEVQIPGAEELEGMRDEKERPLLGEKGLRLAMANGLTQKQVATLAQKLLRQQENNKHLVSGAGDKIADITVNGKPLEGRVQLGDVIEVHIDVNTAYVPEPGPDVAITSNAKNLWGYFGGKKVKKGDAPYTIGEKISDEESYALWHALWEKSRKEGKMKEFWQMVRGPKAGGLEGPPWSPAGAKGFVENEQFEISASYEAVSSHAQELGVISISTEAMTASYQKAAAQIGGDLTEMFNALSALVEDVARFFLIDCGDPAGPATECTEKDVSTRAAAGSKAVRDATIVKDVVDRRIGPSLIDSDNDGIVDKFDQDTYSGEEPHLKVGDDSGVRGVAMGRQVPDSEYGSNE